MNPSTITYHKKTFFPSSSGTIQFKQYDSSKIFFTSGNKLILYDILDNKKLFRMNLRGKKIISLQQNQNDLNEIFILDIDNVFYLFNIFDKTVQCQYSLPSSHRYLSFYIDYSSSQIIFLSSDNSFFLTILELTYTDNNYLLRKVNEYSISLSLSLPSLFNNTFLFYNNHIITYINNTLITHNILSKETQTISFIKRITALSLIPNKPFSLAVGDNVGKIHLVSDIRDKKSVIAIRHWHSHRVNCLEVDSEGMYMYSAGMEGVIVIWNLNTEVKSFLPRLNGVICAMKISDDGKYVIAYLADNSIKVVDIALMRIVGEVCSVMGKEVFVSGCELFRNKMKFLTFANKESGVVYFYQVCKNSFPFYLNIMNKNNVVSSTEKEVHNRKMLTHIAFASSYNGNEDCSYMLTCEQLLTDDDNNKQNIITTYLKFWKITLNDIELTTLAEDPHMTQPILNIIGSKHSFSFISCTKYNFKLWTIQSNCKFVCEYQGQYKQAILLNICFGNDNTIYALYEKYLISYDHKKIDNIYTFASNVKMGNESKLQIMNHEEEFLCVYDKKKLFMFNKDNLNVCWEERIANEKEEIILNVTMTKEHEINVFIRKNENCVYSVKYACDSIKKILMDCLIIEKKGIEYVDVYKRYVIVVNAKKDVFLAERELSQDKLGRITKKEMDDNDLDFR